MSGAVWRVSIVVILLLSVISVVFIAAKTGQENLRMNGGLTYSNSNFTEVSSVEWSNGTPSNTLISIVGSMGMSVAVGDVNNDGKNEVVTASYDSNETSWFHYARQSSLRIWEYSNNKFNLLKEKVWTGPNDGSASVNSIVIYPYNGKKLIITGGSISEGSSNGFLPSYSEIRIWEFANGEINLLSNVSWRDYPDKNNTVNDMWVGDINGDGRPDILTAGDISWSVGSVSNQANYSMAEITMWTINSNFSLSFYAKKIWTDPYINETSAQSVAVYDFDDDGVYEIVAGGYYGYIDSGGVNRTKAEISVWHVNGDSFVKVDDVTWIDHDNCAVFSVKIRDINHDNKAEIIAAGSNKYFSTAGEVSIWSYPLSQIARTQFYVDPDGSLNGNHWDCVGYRLIVDDFDGDGTNDIIVTGFSKGPASGGNTFWGYLDSFNFNGNQIIRIANYYWLDHDATQLLDMCYADMDNDGVKEIFTIGYYTTVSGTTEYLYAKIYVWHYESEVPELNMSIVTIFTAIIIAALITSRRN